MAALINDLNDEAEEIRILFATMGIEAEVSIDRDRKKLMAIKTEQFEPQRRRVESWLTLVEQRGDTSYFHERPRGTGHTG